VKFSLPRRTLEPESTAPYGCQKRDGEPTPFSGVAFPMKLSLPADCHKMACPVKFPCSRRTCSSLAGGSHQPLDRQLSYYRELLRLASNLRNC